MSEVKGHGVDWQQLHHLRPFSPTGWPIRLYFEMVGADVTRLGQLQGHGSEVKVTGHRAKVTVVAGNLIAISALSR
jgi:hypothetical protein